MIQKIFPQFETGIELENLYLSGALPERNTGQPFVYSNYVTSLDGRIAITHPVTGETRVPDSIANPQDWRLYQELAALADVLITSGRYMRDLVAGKAQDELPVGNDPEFDDLRQWRISQGLSPQPAVAILTRSMDLPWERICGHDDRQVLVITTGQNHQQQSAAATDSGATVVRLGDADYVSGVDLVRFLSAQGLQRMYAIAGPMVLETLLRDQVLNRLFMTRVHRIIGGVEFDTILESKRLQPPANMRLVSLYLHQAEVIEQCFACYDLQGEDD